MPKKARWNTSPRHKENAVTTEDVPTLQKPMGGPVVNILRRVKAQQEAKAAIKAKMDAGKSPQDAIDEVLDESSSKYGADPDWSGILDAILKIITLIFSFFNDQPTT